MSVYDSDRPLLIRKLRLVLEYVVAEGVTVRDALVPLAGAGLNSWTFTIESKVVSDGLYEFKLTGKARSKDKEEYADTDQEYGEAYCKLSVLDEQSDEIWSTETTTELPVHNWFQFSKSFLINEGCKILTCVLNMGSCYDKKPRVTELYNRLIDSRQRMLNNGILTDCTIKTKWKNFPCHTFVLSSKSEYFRAMFELDMEESREKVVDWVEIFDGETVQDLLQYLYTGKMPNGIEKTCAKLVEAASLCILEELKDMCAFVMIQNIDIDNVVKILQLAEKHDLGEAKISARSFVQFEYEKVKETAEWQNIEPQLAKKLLSSFLEDALL